MGLKNISVVLVEPLYGGNIGSACRAMANTGVKDLRLVAPQDPDMDEARKMACHAGTILAESRTFATLDEAVGDCGLVVGTTGRAGLYRQHARSPRECAPLIREAGGQGRVALVFGREDSGLSNAELAVCNRLIQIPASTEYPSLNLSQAVLICCYELFLDAGEYLPPEEKSGIATAALRERMFGIWRDLLLQIRFMKTDKADHMMQGIRRLMGRGAQTEDDVRILMGIARQVEWAVGHLHERCPATQDVP